jgi:hypothetical protein
MTNNAALILTALGLPAKTQVAAGDLDVGDWVLLKAPGAEARTGSESPTSSAAVRVESICPSPIGTASVHGGTSTART